MKFPLPATTFPPLQLSEEEQEALVDVAEALVKRFIAEYHGFLAVHQGVVDESRWKKIKQQEDVRVYRERKTSTDRRAAADGNDTSDDATKAVVEHMLTVGSINGSLDDVMYGVLSPTTEAMRLKSAYVKDGFVDQQVLASIIKPTLDSPFRELSIKWSVKPHSSLVGTVTRARDTVVIESIGFAQTPNGERIGYHLGHSVEVRAVRELSDLHIVRANISFCGLFREPKKNTVEVFMRGTMEPMGGVTGSLAASAMADVAVSVRKYVHCAEMKKLTRIVRLPASNASHSHSLASSSSSSSLLSPSSTKCAICSESVGFTMSSLVGVSGKDKRCRICLERVCSRCRVAKVVLLLRPAREEAWSPTSMVFCTRCVLTVARASSTKFAEYDALALDGEATDNFDFGLSFQW